METNVMAKVISLPNENGKLEMDQVLIELANEYDEEERKKSQAKIALIYQAIDVLTDTKKENLPPILPRGQRGPFIYPMITTLGEQTFEHNLELVKALDQEPIYELRINIRELDWRFRAIFFPFDELDRKHELYYCVVFCFDKRDGDKTDDRKERAHAILESLKNCGDYKKYFS